MYFFQFQYSEKSIESKSLLLSDQEQQQNIAFRCTGQQATDSFRPWNLSTGPLPYSSSLTTTAMHPCMVCVGTCAYDALWLTTHSDIHFIIILISTHEQSCYCPHFRVGVIEPQKTINWFSPRTHMK